VNANIESGNGHGKVDKQLRADGRPGKNNGGATGKGFKLGQSGNPRGRPPRREIIGEFIRTYLSKKDLKDPKKRQRLVVAVENLYQKDLKLLFAYAYGKPAEMIEVAASEGSPFEFVVKVRQEELP